MDLIGAGNKGDIAILESEVQELRRLFPNCTITVIASYPESIKSVIPDIDVYQTIVNRPITSADTKTSDRKSLMFKVYFVLYTAQMFFEFVLFTASVVAARLGLPLFYRSDIIKRFNEADLVIKTGGEEYKEGSNFLSNYAFSKQKVGWWLTLFRAMCIAILTGKIFKKSYVMFPCTIGPIRTKIGKFLIKQALVPTNVIMTRDDFSGDTLKSLSIKNFIRTNDVALLLDRSEISKNLLIPCHTIGVSPGLFDLNFNPELKEKYLCAHANVLDQLIETEKFNVVFLPSNLREDIKQTNDVAISKMIIDKMRYKNCVRIITVNDAKELQCILNQLDLLVATRMHPMILAATQNVPFVSIIYDDKQLGFLSDMGLHVCSIKVWEISQEKLQEKITFVLRNSAEIRTGLQRKVSLLRNKTREAIDKVLCGL